jgi:ParB family chromosome partitioning protein
MRKMMQNEKKVLGKGLSALILDNKVMDFEGLIDKESYNKVDLPIDQILPNPWQPRQQFPESELLELKDSIIEHGVIQPIIVRKNNDKYEIVAGERRWQASKLANKLSIPAIIVDFDNKQMLEISLVENIQRQDLNPIDEAKAFKHLMEKYEYTQEQAAKKLGKSRSFIANSVRLLTLPEDVQNKLIIGEISTSHARSLVGKDDASKLASEIVQKKLNVREAENIGRLNSKQSSNSALGHHEDSDIQALERSLSENLGMNVRIRNGHNSGVLSIQFLSLEQLDEIVQKLTSTNLSF